MGDSRGLADDLRPLLVRAAVARLVATPVSHSRLLEMIVATAATVINAQAASLLLVDDAAHELVFEVALGPRAEAVRRYRVPVGHGIAGLVAASGQPIATSAASDPRHAREIAESVGFQPNNILCVPLTHADRVIGVLELLDKIDGTPFSSADMHVLGLFAGQAAIAISQSRTRDTLIDLLAQLVLDSGVDLPEHEREEVDKRLAALAKLMEDDPRARWALEVARLVEEISRQGDDELDTVEAILRAFAAYVRSRQRLSDQLESAELQC
jgi:GAF domain-containing protein